MFWPYRTNEEESRACKKELTIARKNKRIYPFNHSHKSLEDRGCNELRTSLRYYETYSRLSDLGKLAAGSQSFDHTSGM